MSNYPARGTGYLDSPRLRLVPATRAIIRADLRGRDALAARLKVDCPANWPPELFGGPALEYSLRQLDEDAERGWSSWYLHSRREPIELRGICGFKGRPDATGTVEISYSILEQFRRRGLATEAVNRLVRWAFTDPRVKAVSAETLPHLLQSIGVLRNNGFTPAGEGSEYGVVRYAVSRSSLI